MKLFNFFQKKQKTFSDEEIEKEYQKSRKYIQKADANCFSFVRDIKKYAEETCTPKSGDDLMAQKAEFLRIYAFRAYQWRCYYTLAYKKGRLKGYPSWTQKWRDYEQRERFQAQKEWNRLIQEKQLMQKVR